MSNLKDIRTLIERGNINQSITELTGFIGESGLNGLRESVESIQSDYDMMLQFMALGFKDPKRHELLNGIRLRLYEAVSNAEILSEIPKYHFYTSQLKRLNATDLTMENIRQQLENYVAEQAIATLMLNKECGRSKDLTKSMRDGKCEHVGVEGLHAEHHKFMSLLFVKICCSGMWSHAMHRDFADICTSPTIDQRDQQLMVSAITLGCIRFFDREKWFALSDIYQHAEDDSVRQRAFVGWVLSVAKNDIEDSNIDKRIRKMCLDRSTVDAIVEMQMEMLLCSRAEKDQHIINDEIVPGILKNSNYQITPHGLEESEEDELEDILHPEKTDERMDEIQKYFDRVQNMQKDGSDVYFSGFSQMKRFAFFYNISNWFMPFYVEHPEIVSALKGKENIPQMMKIVEALPLCDSDRYSFILGVSSVLDKLPKDVAKAMRDGEIREKPLADELRKRTRLLYLQDLYRYARLFPEEKMFSENIFKILLPGVGMLFNACLEERLVDIIKALRHMGFTEQMDKLLVDFMIWGRDKLDFVLIEAKRYLEKKKYKAAFMDYVMCELASKGRRDIIKATAKVAILDGLYKDAAKRYELLLKKEPNNMTYQLNYCYATVCYGKPEKVIDEMFRIEFEAFESGNEKLSMNARRTLALALLATGRHEEAITRYRKIQKSETASLSDTHALAMALWIDGKTKEALPLLRNYCTETASLEGISFEDSVENMFNADLKMLKIYNTDLTHDDLRLLSEIIKKDNGKG